MTAIHLRLHGDRFALRGPAAALVELGALYHPSVVETDPQPGASTAAAFELVQGEGGWTLLEAGSHEPLGSYAEPVLALLRLEHEIEGRLLGRLGRRLAFHAGAAVTPAGACLVAGSADSGKSSTTLQLVELGHPFLAEEIAAVDDAGRVHPHLQSLAIDPLVIAELESVGPLRHGRVEAVADLLRRYHPSTVATEPAPLGTILLPVFDRRAEARFDEPGLDSVLTDLLTYCFEPAGDPEASIDRVIELASGARLVRMRYPDARSARALLLEIFGGRDA